jgi:hypothetical protein
MDELKNYVYVSIISADNDEFGLSEEDKQEIIYRHKLGSSWDYILEPIKNEKVRKGLIDFFEDEENKEDIRALHGRSLDVDSRADKEILEKRKQMD